MTLLVQKETGHRKKPFKKEITKQTEKCIDHQNQQQEHSTQRKLLLHLSRFNGLVVCTLDSELKDPSSTLGRTLFQFFFDYVDDS